jgi:Methyltransferase domain
LKKEGYNNVRGLDIDKGRIDTARELGLDAEIADGLAVIKTEKNVDVIFSLDFLEHLNKDQAVEYVRDCSLALKSGGLLIVRMPVTDSLMGTYDLYNDFTHKWSGHTGVIANMIQIAGFSKVIIKDERPVLYKPLSYIRFAVFKVLSTLHNLYLTLLGFPKFKIWSRSAFFIATK